MILGSKGQTARGGKARVIAPDYSLNPVSTERDLVLFLHLKK
jgi:hypothetical protein